MNNLKEYLNKHKGSTLTIVGPLYEGGQNWQDPVVFVDGASKFQDNNAGFCIGDGDSSNKEMDEKLNTDKDYSDLQYTFSKIDSRFKEIHLKGFLGGRKDHELINLAEAHQFLKNKSETALVFDDEILAYSSGEWSFHIKTIFSIFIFEEAQLSLKGECKYKINENTHFKALSSQGLSNEGFGEVELKCDEPVFVFTKHFM